MNEFEIRIHSLLSAIAPRGPSLEEDACLLASKVLASIEVLSTGYDPGSRLMESESIGVALRLQVEILGVSEAVGFSNHQFAPIDFSPVDIPMHRCQSVSFGGGQRLRELQQNIGSGHRRFDAVIVPLSVPSPPYTRITYFIESLTPATGALQLVRAQPSEVRHAVVTLEDVRKRVVAAFSVKELNPRLSAAIDTIILQAVAMAGYPIHICSISPPALAKGMLQTIARGIAPSYTASGAKYSLAGLVGSVRVLRDGTHFPDPGYLMRADNGVLGIEDLHNLLVGRHEALVHVLASAMEGGIASDSTRHRIEYRFSTSILADANPSSSIGVSGQELRIPGNLLSRFTAVFHFDSGFDEVVKTAKGMLGAMDRDAVEIRSIRVLLAWLRSQQKAAPRWSEGSKQAALSVLDLITVNMDETDRVLLQHHIVRSANGTRALATAHAVLRGSPDVEGCDIIAVTHILSARYQSLSELLAHRDDTVAHPAEKQGRQTAMIAHFAGQSVSPRDVQCFYRGQGWEVDRQTVHRDLRDLERSRKATRTHGKVTFPPAQAERPSNVTCDMSHGGQPSPDQAANPI